MWNWVHERVHIPSGPNELVYEDQMTVYKTRAEALKETAMTCHNNYRNIGELSELQVRRLDGSWSKDKRTYGKDPAGHG